MLYPSPPHRAVQDKIFEESEVRCSQPGDGIPTLDSLETFRTTPRIVPANDVVQAFESFGIQPRVKEPERGKPCGYAGIVQEGDHTSKGLIGEIRISENVRWT